MTRIRTIQEYRRTDLMIWAFILVVCEFLTVKAANSWFPAQPYTVSVAAAVTTIVYMRWGWWGCFHAFLAGTAFCAASGAQLFSYLIYCTGNLFSVLAVPCLLKVGKERTRTGAFGLFFPILVLLLMQCGRALTALVLGASSASVIGFFTTDSVSLLFTFVVVWVARQLDGIYEDQKHYLLRLSAKEKAEKEVSL
ncbi:MAG: hypothetical protein IJJ44_07060 [Solobacterium sp.]|nr:hypothetical protein [Solobacterium sp.]